MTRTDKTTKTPRATRSWVVYKLVRDDSGDYLRRDGEREHSDLAECAKECEELAIESVGSTFIPVKCGDPVTAQKIEKVVLQ